MRQQEEQRQSCEQLAYSHSTWQYFPENCGIQFDVEEFTIFGYVMESINTELYWLLAFNKFRQSRGACLQRYEKWPERIKNIIDLVQLMHSCIILIYYNKKSILVYKFPKCSHLPISLIYQFKYYATKIFDYQITKFSMSKDDKGQQKKQTSSTIADHDNSRISLTSEGRLRFQLTMRHNYDCQQQRREHSSERSKCSRYTLTWEPDYSLLAYPFQVLATNRMVESFISRKAQTKFSVPGAHMLSDFKDIVRIGGWRGLFRGFAPYLLHSLISESEIGYDKPTMTIIKAQGIYASLMVLFGGPLTIHFTRMQNLDYPSQFRFLKGFSRMITTEGFTPLYRGSLGLLIGVLLQIPLTVASIVVFDLYTYKLTCFMAGIIISHPFYLLATRVMNAPLYREGRDNRAFRNTITAFLYTWKTQGVSGFYRGFAPTLMFNCILWADYLRVMYKDGFCKDE